jgi:glycosyltransferase involved in cell wall biosynthesis
MRSLAVKGLVRRAMFPNHLQPDQVEFVLLSFEGPDAYSKAGGLGVRVSNLAEFLAGRGFQTHLIFIGSPDLPSREERLDGRLHYHRWCQWISRYHPLGVYDGDEGKLVDFNRSVPGYIVENIARSAIVQRRHLVVLAEEWHTAEALIRLSDALYAADLRSNAILLWNANNTMGFERIDWPRLSFVSTLTTVSRYMKQIMRTYGLDPLIIPNGIPSELLNTAPEETVRLVRERLVKGDDLLLFKVGRYDPAKCWLSAVEAAALLKQGGEKVCLLCRGGIEAHGEEVLSHARELGLAVKDVIGSPKTWQEAVEVISGAGAADVYNLCFSMSPEMLRVFYAAADFVLANSKHEPFGLVGLEAMAAGGVVFTGPTGETYSADGAGAIALDTEQPEELVLAIENLQENPDKARIIRQVAPLVAARYTWENVACILFEKICLAKDYQKVRPFRVSLFVTLKLIQNEAAKIRPEQPNLPAWPVPAQLPVEMGMSMVAG